MIAVAPGRESNGHYEMRLPILPGERKRVPFCFMIADSDAEVPLQIQVGMSNEARTDVDGWGFVNGVVFYGPNYECGINLTCYDTEIVQGEDVDVSVNISYAGSEDVKMSVFDKDGNLFTSLEQVVPGDELQFNANFDDLMNTTTLQYSLNIYNMDGSRLLVEDVKSNELTITVNPRPAPNCDFDVLLSADKTSIEAGEDVNFTVLISNTGDGIHELEITDMDAMTMSRLEGLPSGSSGTAPVAQSFTETQDVSFVVVAVIDDIQKTKQTNVITITVIEQEEETLAPIILQANEPEPTKAVLSENTDIDKIDAELETADDGVLAYMNNTNIYIIVLIVVVILLIIVTIILVNLLKDKNRGYKDISDI